MTMTQNLHEAVQLLSDGGVIDRLKDEAQDAKELERAGILARLAQFEQEQAERAATLEKVRPALEKKIAELEAELKATRHELAALDTSSSAYITGDKLRTKLRRLADPRIAQAIVRLGELDGKARGAFAGGTRRVRLLTGGYTTEQVSNGLMVSDLLAGINGTRRELEALQEAKRPEGLAAYLAEKIEPFKQAVQKLHGLN
jgi:hypothetical protein